jgi:predicted transcriptional regulator of viral defense system
MQLNKVLAKIKTLKHPIFQTRDIVALINQSTTNVSKSLARLTTDNHLIHLAKGIWGIRENIDPFMIPTYLTAPFPSYISLQSALYYHGMIEQIPEIIYAVSIGRTKIFQTPVATVSVHHIPSALFFGYQEISKHAIKIATPEKALFDFLYLQPAKTRLFTKLPEFEFPSDFDRKLFLLWLTKVKSPQRKSMMINRFEALQ